MELVRDHDGHPVMNRRSNYRQKINLILWIVKGKVECESSIWQGVWYFNWYTEHWRVVYSKMFLFPLWSCNWLCHVSKCSLLKFKWTFIHHSDTGRYHYYATSHLHLHKSASSLVLVRSEWSLSFHCRIKRFISATAWHSRIFFQLEEYCKYIRIVSRSFSTLMLGIFWECFKVLCFRFSLKFTWSTSCTLKLFNSICVAIIISTPTFNSPTLQTSLFRHFQFLIIWIFNLLPYCNWIISYLGPIGCNDIHSHVIYRCYPDGICSTHFLAVYKPWYIPWPLLRSIETHSNKQQQHRQFVTFVNYESLPTHYLRARSSLHHTQAAHFQPPLLRARVSNKSLKFLHDLDKVSEIMKPSQEMKEDTIVNRWYDNLPPGMTSKTHLCSTRGPFLRCKPLIS